MIQFRLFLWLGVDDDDRDAGDLAAVGLVEQAPVRVARSDRHLWTAHNRAGKFIGTEALQARTLNATDRASLNVCH